MAAPRRATDGSRPPRRFQSARALAHPPGCWKHHPRCALAGARDVERIIRDQHHGASVAFDAALSRMRLVPENQFDEAARQLVVRARTVLRNHTGHH